MMATASEEAMGKTSATTPVKIINKPARKRCLLPLRRAFTRVPGEPVASATDAYALIGLLPLV